MAQNQQTENIVDFSKSKAPDFIEGLKSSDLEDIVKRIERLEEERKTINADISVIKKEAEVKGFDVPTIIDILKLRKKTADEVEKKEVLRDLYKSALNM